MDNTEFVALCSRAWSIPCLAALHDGCIGRSAVLASSVGAGRSAMTASLQHLCTLGLVARASGHGHPLRAEFGLTERGAVVAGWATSLTDALETDAHQALARKSWSLPIQRIVARSPRFAELRRELAPVTDRALSMALKSMTASNWLHRTVAAAAPPIRVSYKATGAGLAVQEALQPSFEL